MKDQAGHVLIIEDNQGDADLVRLRLVEANSGMQVTCASRLSTGLASMTDTPPAVVLLDLNLPDSRGAETFRNLLKKAPGVPVVVLSALEDEDMALKALHHGVQDYLVKGAFDSKQLARAMHYAMVRQALLTSLDMSRKQQLQFKDQFLSHVSHELRTPLSCIHQFATILLDELSGPLSPEQHEHVETVLRSANQLRAMIGDLLEATRAESGKLQVKPGCAVLANVIEQATTMMRAAFRAKTVSLKIDVDERMPLVLADSDRILQVLLNLLDNAIKFTPVDGLVVVRAYVVEAEPNFAYVSVTDTGHGIAPESKALIFERLFQDPQGNDNNRKGLGLGLYIVREIMRLHGGQVSVESQLGQGSTFTFTLPVFSLAKLLTPVITEQGRLREALTLIKVNLTSDGVIDSAGAAERCRELVQACIVPAKDMVLPDLGLEMHDKIFVVASADQGGSEVLTRRIHEQLETEMKSSAAFKISTEAIALPGAAQADLSLAERVQEVTDHIAEMVLAAIGPDIPASVVRNRNN